MKLIPGAINVNTAPLKRTSIAQSLQRGTEYKPPVTLQFPRQGDMEVC